MPGPLTRIRGASPSLVPWGWLTVWAVVFLAVTPGISRAEAPLHEQIDAAIEAALPQYLPEGVTPDQVLKLADDETFIRRLYLDLTGVVPSSDEVRAFLADQTPDKRAKLIDQLLASEAYPRRMRELFNVMLMERRGSSPEWNKYLEESFAANKPWDQLAREILAGEPGEDDSRLGVEFWYTKRLENYGQNPVDYDALARDVGRLFFGVDLQCANCHNHLFIDDYKQPDYKGLFLLVSGTANFKDGNRTRLIEKPLTAKLEFSSVFDNVPMAIGPKVPGLQEVSIPEFPKGEEYAVPPDPKKKVPGVPKFSPRRVLAEQAPESPNFRLNAANRLWWTVMGRGLVEPLDLSHSDNPPSHPDLLALLATELAAHDYDIRWFLRELLLSKTYQRVGTMPEGVTIPPESFAVAQEKPLSAEQLTWSVLQATGNLAAVPGGEAAKLPRLANAAQAKVDGEAKPQPLPKLTVLQQKFETAFANPAMEPEVEFKPSVKAALFLSNDDSILTLLEPRPGNLTDRLLAASDAAAVAEEAYLSVLARRPTQEEQAMVAEYLGQRADDRLQAVKNLAWALLASTEFCLNH